MDQQRQQPALLAARDGGDDSGVTRTVQQLQGGVGGQQRGAYTAGSDRQPASAWSPLSLPAQGPICCPAMRWAAQQPTCTDRQRSASVCTSSGTLPSWRSRAASCKGRRGKGGSTKAHPSRRNASCQSRTLASDRSSIRAFHGAGSGRPGAPPAAQSRGLPGTGRPPRSGRGWTGRRRRRRRGAGAAAGRGWRVRPWRAQPESAAWARRAAG